MTKEAFENTIAVNTAIGGSTNAVIHLIAIAKHIGVPLDCDDWERVGYKLPLIVNVQPAGEWCVWITRSKGYHSDVRWQALRGIPQSRRSARCYCGDA